MKIINTNPNGNRILHTVKNERNYPDVSFWYFNADNMDLLFGLLEADDIKIDTWEKGEDCNYLICQRRDDQSTGAVALKFTREGEEEIQDYVIHDIGYEEGFVLAMEIIG